jgi:hypothetical protein
MKNSRKFLLIAVFAASAALVFTGCGGKSGGSSGGSSGSSGSGKTLSAGKATPATDFQYDATKDGKGVVIKRYIGKDGGKITIPATIEDLPVVEIGHSAFAEQYNDNDMKRSRITSVYIPDSVTTLGYGVFEACKSLTQVRLPEKITAIPRGCFSANDREYAVPLAEITIPASVQSIGSFAFFQCNKLTTVTIPESVQSIGTSAFDSCPELTTVNLPSHPIKYMNRDGDKERPDNAAFGGCPKLSLKVRAAIKASGYQGSFD